MRNKHYYNGRRLLLASLMMTAGFAGGGMATANAADRSGKEVVEATCINCHEKGKDGAPRIGNTAEWSERAKYGLPRLLGSSMEGLRKMPAHGGEAKLTDLEMTRAIAYMVSGGQTVDPEKPVTNVSHGTGEEIFTHACINCHGEGKHGAPRLGDREAWLPRLKNGVPGLAVSAVNGHNKMPSRGGFSNLSDVDIRAAVSYMANKASAQQK